MHFGCCNVQIYTLFLHQKTLLSLLLQKDFHLFDREARNTKSGVERGTRIASQNIKKCLRALEHFSVAKNMLFKITKS